MGVTTKDVAERAGVSTATAARVLGNYGSVKPETRERVLRAAHELNYTPNLIARSMVKLQTQTIGLIVPDIRNTFFTHLARSVERTARQAGYRIMMCDTDSDFEQEEVLLRDLLKRRVDGIILSSVAPAGKPHRTLERAPVPVVLVDRSLAGARFDTVRTDHQEGAYQAVRHLISLGHRHIGVVIGTGSESVHAERLRGYRKAIAQAGLPFDERLVKMRDWERGLGALRELLDLRPRPTALFTTNNVVTLGMLVDLKREGLRIPTDMAVVAFDDLDTGHLLESPLTAVVQNPSLIGRTAILTLLQRMEGKDDRATSPQEIVFRPSLIVRASCGAESPARKEASPQDE